MFEGEVSSWFSKMSDSGLKTPKCRRHLIGLNQMLLSHGGCLSLVSCALHLIAVGVHFCQSLICYVVLPYQYIHLPSEYQA